MSASKEFTLQEISEHNTKKDLYLIVHDKVYDCSSFVDEHPYVTSPHTDIKFKTDSKPPVVVRRSSST
jgi:cytochrome b involved in lipid metabolism